MNRMHGILFAYEKAQGLRDLVEPRMPGSLPFGGRYRSVDFMLSNFIHAGINDVGVVLSGSYQSLLDHIGSGKVWDMSRRYGGLRLLPPFAGGGGQNGAFRGKMDALASVYSYLKEIRQDYVVLAESDLLINLALDTVLEAHIASGAELTVLCTAQKAEEGQQANYISLNGEGRITEVSCHLGKEGQLRTLGIYLLRKELLLALVENCAARGMVSLHRDVLQTRLSQLRMHGYVWEGYAAQPRTVADYYRRSMELLDPAVRAELFSAERPIRAKEEDGPSAYIDPDGICRSSLIADGCCIEGTVEGSILFPGVRVERGAVVKHCILFKNSVVRRDASLHYVITDKRVEVLEGRTLMGHEQYPMLVAKGRTV